MNGRKEGIQGGEVVGVKRKERARNKKRGQWSRGGKNVEEEERSTFLWELAAESLCLGGIVSGSTKKQAFTGTNPQPHSLQEQPPALQPGPQVRHEREISEGAEKKK